MMKKTFQYCSEATQHINEPLAGTAPHVKHWVSISWPKKLWQEEALNSKGFPASIPEWQKQQNIISGKIAVRLISKENTSKDKVQIFIYPEGIHYNDVPPQEIVNVLQNHYLEKKDTRFLKSNPEPFQLFICTHGRHDKCCALFGQAVYQKFREVIEERQLPIDLWQSTHIGGHRFAATGIVFPHGHVYGRMKVEDVEPILDSIIKTEVYVSNYRGCYLYGPKEQVVEAYAHQKGLKEDRAYTFQKIETKEISDNRFQGLVDIQFDSDQEVILKQLKLNFYKKSFLGPASCDQLNGVDMESKTRWVFASESN